MYAASSDHEFEEMMWEEDDNHEFEEITLGENDNVEGSVESVDSLQPETEPEAESETGGVFCMLYSFLLTNLFGIVLMVCILK